MRYSNGFFVFKYDGNKELLSGTHDDSLIEVWLQKPNVNYFTHYYYSWLLVDHNTAFSQFNDANIWIDEKRQIIIIFLQIEHLVKDVTEAINRKFGIECKPYILPPTPIPFNNGTYIIPRIGIDNLINKVKTTLIKDDSERLFTIEKLLVGG